MGKDVRVVIVEPHTPAKEAVIKDDLSSLQKIVDGWIEITYPFDDDVCVVGNEEAKLIGMEGTARINGSVYCGPLIIVGESEDGEFADLTDEQVQAYVDMFSEPDEISKEEIEDDMGFTIWGWN